MHRVDGAESVRIAFIGNAMAGKTSLIATIVDDEFIENRRSTIGTDFRIRQFEVKGQTCICQLYDTAGQERYNSLSLQFLRGINGIIFVCDLTSEDSLDAIIQWKEKIADKLGRYSHGIPMMLLGNKSDLPHSITLNRLEKFSIDHNIGLCGIVSAKTKEGVNQSLRRFLNVCMKSDEHGNTKSETDAILHCQEKSVECC